MEDLDPIRNLRFEGFDIPKLLEWIGKIKDGSGSPDSMDRAAIALEQCAQIVTELDTTLRTELGKLQIDWQGNAGSIAQEATKQQTAVMQQSQDPLAMSASGVEAQGRGFESVKHTLPNQSEMQHQKDENFFEWAGGPFGYTSDYDAEAKQIDGRKQAAQQALGTYRDTTVTQAESFQPLPEMKPAAVTAQSAAPSGSGGSDIGAFGAASGGGAGGSDGAAGGVGSVGGGYPGGGYSGSDGDDPPAGGRSGSKIDPQRPTGGDPARDPQETSGQGGIGLGGALGIGAGGAAVAGLGALAAGKMLGGKGGGAAEGGTRGGGSAGGKAPEGGVRAGGSSGVGGGPGDTTAGRTASGASTSKPGPGSMMGPAATRGPQESDEDTEHENKYYEEETPFDDNRLVAPSVLGADREPDREDSQKQD